jgi:hypothetical protein
MRIFDYKFIIILGMSLVIYFLYRDIEKLSNKVNQLENNYYKSLDNIEVPSPINTNNDVTNNVTNNDVIQLPMPINNNDIESPTQINNDNINNDNINNDNINNDKYIELPLPNNIVELTSTADINLNIPLALNDDYIQQNDNDDYIQQNDNGDDIIEEYSQDNDSEKLIYSNDNEDNATSAVESIINLNNVSENDDNKTSPVETIDDLLKNNKLAELQEMAFNLNIDIINIETSKKKTKLQLATDIISKKNI